MSTYLNLLPWLKARHSKRGWRVGVGPRAFRRWYGAGGSGTSTGAGPFSFYRADPRHYRTCGTCGAGRDQPCRSVRDGRRLKRVHNGRKS